jgi:hypothetical protein
VVEVAELEGSASTLLRAPSRAVFGRGRARTAPLGGGELGRARAAAETNLLLAADVKDALDTSGLFHIAADGDASLSLDGVSLGPTPVEVRAPRGRHYLELSRRGLVVSHRFLEFGPDPGELRQALPPEPDAPSEPVEIGDMVRRRASQIRSCYERRLKVDHTLEGAVSLRLHVGDTGRVTQTKVEESTLADPLVGECLRHEAATWRFDAGRNATVVYPFVFRPQ